MVKRKTKPFPGSLVRPQRLGIGSALQFGNTPGDTRVEQKVMGVAAWGEGQQNSVSGKNGTDTFLGERENLQG